MKSETFDSLAKHRNRSSNTFYSILFAMLITMIFSPVFVDTNVHAIQLFCIFITLWVRCSYIHTVATSSKSSNSGTFSTSTQTRKYFYVLLFVGSFFLRCCSCRESITLKAPHSRIDCECIVASGRIEGSKNTDNVCSTRKFQVENKNVTLAAMASQLTSPPSSPLLPPRAHTQPQQTSFVCSSKF